MTKLHTFLSAVLLSMLCITGCNNTSQEKQSDMHNGDATHTHIHPPGTDPKNIDPICDMVRDETWTDYMVYNNDSVWFCSEYCKDAFAANPAKYRN